MKLINCPFCNCNGAQFNFYEDEGEYFCSSSCIENFKEKIKPLKDKLKHISKVLDKAAIEGKVCNDIYRSTVENLSIYLMEYREEKP